MLLCFLLAAVPMRPAAADGCGVIVYEPVTGRVLYAENPDLPLPMASTTKILTALLALEHPAVDQPFQVGNEVLVEGSSMGLSPGDTVTLRTLAAGMLLESGNDAANAAAVRIGGSVEGFTYRMNLRAGALSMTGSSFETPSGLDGAQHYATARDMAVLAAAALENPDFLAICSAQQMTVWFGQPPVEHTLYNHNRLLQRYAGCVGVKTGFTKKAGRCLVSAAERDGVRLICVTLGVYDDWNLHSALLDRGFAMLTPTACESRLVPMMLPVAGGTRSTAALQVGPAPMIPLLEGETLTERVWLPPRLFAPVANGQVVGWVEYLLEEAVVAKAPITVRGGVPAAAVPERGVLTGCR